MFVFCSLWVVWALGAPLHAQGVSIVEHREYPETGALAPGMVECNASWQAPVLSDGTTLEVSSHSVAGHPRIALYAADPDLGALHIVADWPSGLSDGGYAVSEIDLNQDQRAEILVHLRAEHTTRHELYGRDDNGRWRLILMARSNMRDGLRSVAQDIESGVRTEWGFRTRNFEGEVVMQTRGERFPEHRCLWWSAGQGLWQYRSTSAVCPGSADNDQSASRMVLWARVLSPYWRAQRDRYREHQEETDVDIEALYDCLSE